MIATYDSFLKSALPIAGHLGRGGYEVRFVLAEARANQISAGQLAALGLEVGVEARPLVEILRGPELYLADVVVLAMDGARTAEFLYRFRAGLPADARRRPITVAGYPGVVFQTALHGLINRCGCDLLLLNSPADYEDYLGVCRTFDLEPDNGLCFGLTVLAGAPRARPAVWPPRNVAFLEQPDMPRHKIERLYILDRLIEYATRHPSREVLIKPRHRPGETTLKRTTFHLEPMLARVRRSGALPDNLRLTYEPVEQLLEQADLCLTVSSTAALQAAALGVPFGIITDFGVREDYGTHFFVGSGALVTFDDLLQDRRPGLDEAWRARHVAAAAGNLELLTRRIDALLTAQAESGRPLPFRDTPFDHQRAAYFRYRFADEGRAAARASGRPAKAAMWFGSHPLYRKGRKLLRRPGLFFADLARKLSGAGIERLRPLHWRAAPAPACVPPRQSS